MEAMFGFASLICGLLYLVLIMVLWDLRTAEFYFYRIIFVFGIVVLSLLGGLYVSAGIWILNMFINAFLFGLYSK